VEPVVHLREGQAPEPGHAALLVAEHSTQLRDLADAIGAAAAGTSDQDRRVAVAVYELLADGSPVTATAAAAREGVDQRAVGERVDAWPGLTRSWSSR
jgi:hypothetical protein